MTTIKVKVRNKITRRRLFIIAALVGVEAFVQPINMILSQGAWPEPVQVAGCLTAAIMQVTTLTLGLLEKA